MITKFLCFCLILFCNPFVAVAQENRMKALDSLAMVSRGKADIILNIFKDVDAPIMLYSLHDEDYYIIIKGKSGYEEFYAHLDRYSCIDSIKHIHNCFVSCERAKDLQLLSEAEPIFDLRRYHTGYITTETDSILQPGAKSYFVIKDIDGTRYGEFRLPWFDGAKHIGIQLLAYLTRSLTFLRTCDSCHSRKVFNRPVVLNQSNHPVELNSYYPYGGLMGATTSEGTQPYKYSAKELDRENGLDWYDFEARKENLLRLRFTVLMLNQLM